MPGFICELARLDPGCREAARMRDDRTWAQAAAGGTGFRLRACESPVIRDTLRGYCECAITNSPRHEGLNVLIVTDVIVAKRVLCVIWVGVFRISGRNPHGRPGYGRNSRDSRIAVQGRGAASGSTHRMVRLLPAKSGQVNANRNALLPITCRVAGTRRFVRRSS